MVVGQSRDKVFRSLSIGIARQGYAIVGLMAEVDPRFKGTHQLLGDQHFNRIRSSSVCIVGLGGVGSWSVEALVRSGVGAITLVDLDEVCVTNINRQIHALTDTVGKSKAELLAERIRAINPECKLSVIRKFFSQSTAEEVLSPGFDVVLDTIDRNENKTLLLAECVKRSMRVVTVGSGGDRTDASTAVVTDLARTIHDPLLQIVRKQLRQQYGFPKGERAKFGIPCVYAPLQRNQRDAEMAMDCTADKPGRKSCNDGLGSAVFVTGALGFMAAGEVIRLLGESKPQVLYPWYQRHNLTT
jgi:tRNA A37 threonylcarbamoyladenosine dehydratase